MATDKFIKKGTKVVIKKDPQAVLDYVVSFVDWLALVGDTILSASAPTVTGGVVVESVTYDSTDVTIWVSGGTVLPPGGGYASVTVRINTTAGRIDERTIYFKVLER